MDLLQTISATNSLATAILALTNVFAPVITYFLGRGHGNKKTSRIAERYSKGIFKLDEKGRLLDANTGKPLVGTGRESPQAIAGEPK